jgi:hypothetical protein
LRARADGRSARRTGHGRARIAALAVALAATVGAPVALAAERQLDGSPIDVYTDGTGRMQFRYDGVADGVFFPPASNAPNAGLEVWVDDIVYSLGQAAPLTGPDEVTLPDGSRALRSTYDFGTPAVIHVDEEVAYHDGAQTADVTYTLTKVPTATFKDARAALLADLYVAGSDEGVGVFSGEAPNRFIGGQSAAGTVSGLSEITRWDTFQEGQYHGPDDVFTTFADTGRLNNGFNRDYVDNTVGVQWDLKALDTPRIIQTRWTLGAPPAPPLAAQAPTPAPTPTPLPPPVAGKTVNIKLLSGTVLYKLPGTKTFQTLTAEAQVPVGTTLDTVKGRVNITSASDLKGGTNKSWFYSGVFTVRQAVAAKPVTELALAGPKPSCKASKAASAAAAKPKTRKLWGDGSGSFRTRGEFSSATVRGTKWVVIDRCDGTLTRVVTGVVSVRDFVKRKTIVLRAGKQYLARKKK